MPLCLNLDINNVQVPTTTDVFSTSSAFWIKYLLVLAYCCLSATQGCRGLTDFTVQDWWTILLYQTTIATESDCRVWEADLSGLCQVAHDFKSAEIKTDDIVTRWQQEERDELTLGTQATRLQMFSQVDVALSS